jgi:hypothetical protein
MKSTKQVRAWIRAHVGNVTVYTNKVKNPAVRHVKVYRDNLTLDQLGALATFAGSRNVNITYPTRGYPDTYGSQPGLIIRCMYEPYFDEK